MGHGKRAAAVALLLCLLAPTVGLGHPAHSEAIRRISELRMPGGKETIKGHCSFHVAGGYLVFEFLPVEAKGAPGGKGYSGVINIRRSTGSLFQAEGGPLSQGSVTLAQPSLDVVHMKSGVLASWDDGCALLVSGKPLKADHDCAGCSLHFTERPDETQPKEAGRIQP